MQYDSTVVCKAEWSGNRNKVPEFYLITTTQNKKGWWRRVTEADADFIEMEAYHRIIELYGVIYINRNYGYLTGDNIQTIHKRVEQNDFPSDIE